MPVPSSQLTLLAKATSERELTDNVIELAQTLGWKVVHFRPALTNKGWRTAGQGDVVGWPDVVAVRNDRVVVAELKRQGEKPTCEQEQWLCAWAIAGAETTVWRPKDWLDGSIEAALR